MDAIDHHISEIEKLSNEVSISFFNLQILFRLISYLFIQSKDSSLFMNTASEPHHLFFSTDCLSTLVFIIQIAEEREKVLKDPKSIMPAAFVSFKSRWGAAVCAQTQQSRNPTLWLTDWAPEPRDVYWQNLSIPYVSIAVRRLIMAVAFFFLTFFFMIPIASVQALATIEGLEKAAPFLKALVEM